MSGVLIVDWLGRGGIAHCTSAWVHALRLKGVMPTVVTRAGRELSAELQGVVSVDAAGHPLLAHAAVARAAAAATLAERPDLVVVQNYIVPPLERPLYAAVRSVNARLVVVIHDHRLHSPFAGTRLGLRLTLRRADVVLAHSAFVAEGVRAYSGRSDIRVFPLPVQVGLVGEAPTPPLRREQHIAIHFGVAKRHYKGTELVCRLAGEGVPGWRFVLAGTGVPPTVKGASTMSGFLPGGELVEAVAAASAAVLPYHIATQSGAVVLAQALGCVPVVTAVGGLPEQVEDGVTGLLLPRETGVPAWRDALLRLAEPGRVEEVGRRAQASAWEGHRRFVDGVSSLLED